MAYNHFNRGRFAQALKVLDSLTDQLSTGKLNEVNFFRAICHIELDQSRDAVGLLNSIQEGDFFYDAQWYQALALLKENQEALAIKVLTELSQNSNPYNKQAQEILELLE